MTAVVVALTLVVALLGVLVVGLLRSHADILRSLHSLGVDLDPSVARPMALSVPGPTRGPVGAGMVVPADVTGHDPAGGSISVALVGEDRLTLLAFLSSGCLTCRPMWEQLGAPGLELPGGARPVAVTKGPHEESPAAVRSLTTAHRATVMSSEAWDAFQVPGSPYFVLVDGTGTVMGEGTAPAWDRVVELLAEALGDRGLDGSRRPAPDPRRGGAGRERHAYVDDSLGASGIGPGHPSLYPDAVEEAVDHEALDR